MIIGVPKEIKTKETRVSITPDGVKKLTSAGHTVWVEKNAGLLTGFSNQAYIDAGAQLEDDVSEIWQNVDMIVKVKEPLASEWPMMRAGQVMFTYLHLAADRALTDAVVAKKYPPPLALPSWGTARSRPPLICRSGIDFVGVHSKPGSTRPPSATFWCGPSWPATRARRSRWVCWTTPSTPATRTSPSGSKPGSRATSSSSSSSRADSPARSRTCLSGFRTLSSAPEEKK